MDKQYLIGSKIWLRAMEPTDLDVLYTLENNPESWEISNFSVPYSKSVLRKYIETSESDLYADKQLRLMISPLSSIKVFGTIDLYEFSPRHAHAEVGVTILNEYRNKGVAKEALELICNYVFGFLQLKQLTAKILVDNAACLKIFKDNGFEECGLIKEWWKAYGKYNDVILLQRINTNNVV